MVEIGRLQSLFTDHVVHQDRLIDTIQTNAINSSEDIKFGNEQIREVGVQFLRSLFRR